MFLISDSFFVVRLAGMGWLQKNATVELTLKAKRKGERALVGDVAMVYVAHERCREIFDLLEMLRMFGKILCRMAVRANWVVELRIQRAVRFERVGSSISCAKSMGMWSQGPPPPPPPPP